MSRQDKATTERHARILRDLVKQPDNKNCADCRKNDARWASWNLGVYLCIRCSGIHRSMGTHISKVKSIDLDIWTPEQMETVQKWGNKRANMYWERHLKSGHVPPDHKIESFIRSKYESRRWAMDGPPPSDPSTLENGVGSNGNAEASSTSTAPPPAPASLPKAHPLLSRTGAPTKSAAPAPAPILDLFADDPSPAPSNITPAPRASFTNARQASATVGATPSIPSSTAAPTTAPTSTPQPSNIFDLDFRAPTPTANKPQTAKADIMSLFSSNSSAAQSPPIATGGGGNQNSFFSSMASPPIPAQNQYASWSGGVTSSAPPQPQVQAQHTAQISGTGGAGGASSGWGGYGMGGEQNAWGGGGGVQSAPVGAGANANVWGSGSGAGAGSAQTMDPWASVGFAQNSGAGLGQQAQAQAQKKKEQDPFANIWE